MCVDRLVFDDEICAPNDRLSVASSRSLERMISGARQGKEAAVTACFARRRKGNTCQVFKLLLLRRLYSHRELC